MKTRTFLHIVLASLLVLFISGCGGGGDDSAGVSNSDGGSSSTSTQTISGVVTAPGGAVAMLENKTLFASVIDSIFPRAHAAVIGLRPISGATVELILIDDSGNQVGDVIATVTTAADGSFSIETSEAFGSNLVLRVQSSSNPGVIMRAVVGGTTVNINPNSEFVLSKILELVASTNGATLGHFSNDEIQALLDAVNALVVDLTGMTLADAMAELDDIDETFDDDVKGKIFANFSGRWDYTDTVTSNSCPDGFGDPVDTVYEGSVIVTQDGTKLLIQEADENDIVAEISDRTIIWEISLMGLTEAGEVTITGRSEMAISEDGSSASGTSTLSVTGAVTCSSASSIVATAVADEPNLVGFFGSGVVTRGNSFAGYGFLLRTDGVRIVDDSLFDSNIPILDLSGQ